MKKIILVQALVILTLLFGLSSCDKSDTNSSDDGFISNYTNTTISGIVFDQNHFPIQNAKVTAHGQVRFTDQNGIFVFSKIAVPKRKCYVVVEYNNYFTIMRSLAPVSKGVTRIDAHLIPKWNGQQDVFPSSSAYTAFLMDGSTINFPASTNFVYENGNPYSGNVYLNTYVLDPTTDMYSRQVPGGDQIGMDHNEEQMMDAYTGTLVELTDANGMPLQLANNTTPVLISQEIPAALAGGAPITIPAYYASNSNGDNSREGSADKNGSKFEHEVGHFSYWSTQVTSPDYGKIVCRVIDASGHPISGVRVQVGQAYGITGENGTFERKVPTGITIPVAVRAYDFYGISVVSNQAPWSSYEERLVELQLPVDLDRVQGTVVDCNNAPIEAMVALSWNGFVSNIYTTNGTFNLPTQAGMSGYMLNILTDHVDTLIPINVNYGLTDLGNISICAPEPLSTHNLVEVTNPDSTVTYTNFNTVAEGYMELDTIFNEISQTYINISGADGQIDLYLSHIGSAGSYPIGVDVSCYFMSSQSMSYQLESGTVNITEYGEVGGLIKGTVDGATMYGETLHIEFEVIRSANVNTGY